MSETSPQLSRRERNRQQQRRILLLTFLVGLLCTLGVVAATYGPRWWAVSAYEPKRGDVIFQPLPHSPLVNSIESVTGSPASHCGIVDLQDGEWIVIEAYTQVEMTPVREFLSRGRDGAFAVYRLNEEHRKRIPDMLASARNMLGRPYDSRYRMDDRAIYCSELIWKAFHEASQGDSLGELDRLGDLNWKPSAETIRNYEKGEVPLDRKMITPVGLANAPQLREVCSHRMSLSK